MKAMILSAGKGTRITSVRNDIPKILIPLLDKPMIWWNIELLKKYNINDIAINTHHMSSLVKEQLGSGEKFGVKLNYSYEKELLGTSGSLHNFKDFFTDTFIVIYGDVISTMDLSKLIKFHKENKSDVTLVVHETDHPEDSDIVEMESKYKVKNLHHKPGSDKYGRVGNAALYIIEPMVFNYLPEGKSDFIKDVFPKIIEDSKRIFAYNTDEFLKDAGTPKRLKQVESFLKNLKTHE